MTDQMVLKQLFKIVILYLTFIELNVKLKLEKNLIALEVTNLIAKLASDFFHNCWIKLFWVVSVFSNIAQMLMRESAG